ncbi:MAG: hypothetical protein MZU91_01100 [Desulfosudis oleivorans]|nr:hypothetical protein [Desulfosudis oleivorans]
MNALPRRHRRAGTAVQNDCRPALPAACRPAPRGVSAGPSPPLQRQAVAGAAVLREQVQQLAAARSGAAGPAARLSAARARQPRAAHASFATSQNEPDQMRPVSPISSS